MQHFRVIIGAFVALMFVPPLEASSLFDSRPPEFYGSIEKQRAQQELASEFGISLILTDEDLRAEIAADNLVRLEDGEWYYLDEDLGRGYHKPELLRYVRPWVRTWLNALAERFHQTFSKKLKVTSLVRTEARQRQLQRWELNAASTVPTAHLTGAAIDISKLGMSRAELRWMRQELATMVANATVVVVEEMNVLNFHTLILPPPQNALAYSPRSRRPESDHDCLQRGVSWAR